MTHEVPCRRPENNPDDWFIAKDGKQYPDEDLVPDDAMVAHLNDIDPDGALSEFEIERVRNRLLSDAKRDAIARRRHAREKCHSECYFRTQCLDLGLTEEVGTWGGYYEEDLRELRRERSRRKGKKNG